MTSAQQHIQAQQGISSSPAAYIIKTGILLSIVFFMVQLLSTASAADCPVKLTKCNGTDIVTCLRRDGNCQCSCIKKSDGCSTPWKWGFCSWWQRISCDFKDGACICRCAYSHHVAGITETCLTPIFDFDFTPPSCTTVRTDQAGAKGGGVGLNFPVAMKEIWLGLSILFVAAAAVNTGRHPSCVTRCRNSTTRSCLHIRNGECKCGCVGFNKLCAPWNTTKCRPCGPYPTCYLIDRECDCYC
ncbi:uncharacterized protein [Dermacentor andersoni]|uniref:uncharacterized protein isoform X2 n=1 Tax=Dermacentor andersoni TaxID=34620 RepID=UPI002415A503|nr:uncharacterized protein LOC126533834 isoform X2 [Dermacentor andersoni]